MLLILIDLLNSLCLEIVHSLSPVHFFARSGVLEAGEVVWLLSLLISLDHDVRPVSAYEDLSWHARIQFAPVLLDLLSS